MPTTDEQLKQALATIWALVYRATQVLYLDQEQASKLKNALNVISEGRDGDDYFNRRASFVCDCVHTCGILSIRPRKPTGTDEIMGDCEHLQRHLEHPNSK